MNYAIFTLWNSLHTTPKVGKFAFGPLVRAVHIMRTRGIRYDEVHVSSRFGEQLFQRRWGNERESDVRYIYPDDRRREEKKGTFQFTIYTWVCAIRSY